MNIVTSQFTHEDHLHPELREVLNLVAAYGRKARLTAEAAGDQETLAVYQKIVNCVNEYLDSLGKEEN